jgi:hypothetical protein
MAGLRLQRKVDREATRQGGKKSRKEDLGRRIEQAGEVTENLSEAFQD